MIVLPTYDILSFTWSSKTRCFAQDAWNLEWTDEDYNTTVFPNMMEPFYIKNYVTGEQRLFTFVEDLSGDWIFINEEDNITCIITVLPF